MSAKKFENIGNQSIRNIINGEHIYEELAEFVKNKNIANENIKKWINTVVKNYIIQKTNLKIVELSDLSDYLQNFVKNKKIVPPYHTVDISPEFKDKLAHCVDYLQSSFSSGKDLSRVSFEQAEENAEVWLANRLKNLSSEDDVENVALIERFEYEGRTYSWVNIRSYKALQYESKMMNHCIETYWEKDFPNVTKVKEETPYYSLRDEKNIPIISLFRHLLDVSEIITESDKKLASKFIVSEIKEKNNQYLSHKHRPLVDHFLKNKDVVFKPGEDSLSHYYTVLGMLNENINQSINTIIENGLSFHTDKKLKIEDFKDSFSEEDLYNIGNWKELNINGEINSIRLKKGFIVLSAEKINIENFSDKKFDIESNQFRLKSIKNSDITIKCIGSKDKEQIYLFENLHDCNIGLIKTNGESKNWCIFKNCSNITTNIMNHGTPENKILLNMIKIDCFNMVESHIDFKNTISKDTLEVNNTLDCKTVSGSDYAKYKFIIDSLNRYVYYYNWGQEKNNVFLNFIHEIAVGSYMDNELLSKNAEQLCYDVFRNTESYFVSEFERYEKSHYKNYDKFIMDNLFNIMRLKLEKNYTNSIEIVDLSEKYIEKKLKTARPTLKRTLDDGEDNFLNYMREVFIIRNFNNNTNTNTNTNISKLLLIYMFKNELMEYVTKNIDREHKSAHRFALTEKRLTKSMCEKFVDFIGYTDELDRKRMIDILSQPFDGNQLLIDFKERNGLNMNQSESEITKARFLGNKC